MKKILVALLIACMVLSCSSAFAAEVTVSTRDGLQNAIDTASGDTTIIIAPGSVINGNVTVVQKPGINYTIKGDGSSTVMHGGIIVDGYGKLANEETLVIDGIVFDAEGVSSLTNDSFIAMAITQSGKDGWTYAYCYPHNITVRNCTFKDDNAAKKFVAVKFNSSYRNLLIEDCTATGLHSLLQSASGSGTTVVDNATVTNCKNGISFGNSLNCTVKNSTISTANPDGDGYGVRFDKIGNDNTDPGNFVTDNTITSDYPVVIRQKEESSAAKKYTITGNTFVVTAEDLTDTYLKDEVTCSPENTNVKIIEDDNDVYFGEIPVVEISFAAGEGTGSMVPVEVTVGDSYTIPECKFEAPEGKQFSCWKIEDDGVLFAGDVIEVTENITLIAVWEDIAAAPVVTPAPTAAPAAPAAPKTGDNTNIALWMALMAISCVALVTIGKKSKASK